MITITLHLDRLAKFLDHVAVKIADVSTWIREQSTSDEKKKP
jgi:hypothetical protein